MTLLELKVNCIKNVSRNNDTTFTTDNYYDFTNSPLYADYINNIDIDINQAIARLVTSGKLPSITVSVSNASNLEDLGIYSKIDLSSFETPVYRVKKVYFYPVTGGIIHPQFSRIDKNSLLVTKYTVSGTYSIVYSININYLSDDNLELSTLGIDNTLIHSFIIPFVKAKLWESEEPNLSQQYMNYAESYLSVCDNNEVNMEQSQVEIVHDWY